MRLSDADCETAINGCASEKNPTFSNGEANAGKMWNAARRGERPFSNERMTRLAAAADKLGFWKLGHEFNKIEDDFQTTFILRMLAVDGFHNQSVFRNQFAKLQKLLHTKLTDLCSASERNFLSRKAKAIHALEEWDDFVKDLPSSAGSIWISQHLEASFEDFENEARRWILRPHRSIKLIAGLRFGGNLRWLHMTRSQVVVLHLRPSLFYGRGACIRHAKKGTTGTKLKL